MERVPAIDFFSRNINEDGLLRALLFYPERVGALWPAGEGSLLPGPIFDWDGMVETAQREGVSAILYHSLREQRLEALVPPDILAALSQTYHTNLKRNLLTIRELRKVLNALRSADIRCIVLKGIALAEHVYPNIALRGMSDVDLLIKKEDLLRVDTLLAVMGFLPRDGIAAQSLNHPAGYLSSLEYREDQSSPLNLHLHWHPVNTSVPATAFIRRIDLDRLWEKSETVQIADSQARMLSPEHLILYLCEHALRVGHSFDRMILLCDLFFAIKALAGRLEWGALVEEGRLTGLSRFAFHGLTIVKHFTALPIPEDCLSQLQPPDLSWGERFFLNLQRGNRRMRGSSYLVYLSMNRGLSRKIGFIAHTFFPPRRVLLQRRQVKESRILDLYYAARIAEIFSHLSRSLRRWPPSKSPTCIIHAPERRGPGQTCGGRSKSFSSTQHR